MVGGYHSRNVNPDMMFRQKLGENWREMTPFGPILDTIETF
jgi:hypothetical protein